MSTPTFPRTDSLQARALMRLLTQRRITHRDFQDETSTYRLSGYIEPLRNRHHWPIDSAEEIAQTNDPTGRIAVYCRYFIETDVLIGLKLLLGDRLVKFIDAVQRFEAGDAR